MVRATPSLRAMSLLSVDLAQEPPLNTPRSSDGYGGPRRLDQQSVAGRLAVVRDRDLGRPLVSRQDAGRAVESLSEARTFRDRRSDMRACAPPDCSELLAGLGLPLVPMGLWP